MISLKLMLKLIAPIETKVHVTLRLFIQRKEEFQIVKGTLPLSK